MDPLSIAMGLSQFVPKIAKWITGSDKAEEVAQKAIDIAKTVTGAATGNDALAALQADPSLAMQYQKSVLDQEEHFQALAVQNAGDINTTMRAEAGSEHWPTYSWRPAIGFSFAMLGLCGGITAAIAYLGVMFFHVDPDVLTYLPGMLGAEAAIMATMAPVLGVASWFRGKMQSDPVIPAKIKISKLK